MGLASFIAVLCGAARTFGSAVARAFYPPACAGCGGAARDGLCAACLVAVAPPGPRCGRCGAWGYEARAGCRTCCGRDLGVERVVAIGPYEGVLRLIVRRLKYGGRQSAARPLGRLLGEKVAAARIAADLVVPVPLDAGRERERGFNQAELIARDVARRLRIPLAHRALRRVRATRALFGLGARERREALAGAFAARDRAAIAGKRILLVDDVVTTGATVAACAAACRAAGAAAVHAACAARTTWAAGPPLP